MNPLEPEIRAAASPADAIGVRNGQLLELTVEDLAFGGRALSKAGGFVTFIENALPGDLVLARVYRKRKRYAEAHAERIIQPSPFRVEPRCEHVPVCGGCRFQDLAYTEQLRHKERQVAECLTHLGRIRVEPRPAIPAAQLFHYRNKMEYSFGRDAEGKLTLGLHIRGSFDRTFDLRRCHIATPISSEIVTAVRDAAQREGLAPYDTRTHAGLLRYLVVREGVRTGQVMVNLVATEHSPALDRIAAAIRRDFPAVTGVLLSLTRRRAQVATGEEERVLSGAPVIQERLGGIVFEISPTSFFQTNTEQAERLLETGLEGLALTGHETVLDVYSGTGTFTLPIALRAREAIGIESSPDAVRDAERNAERNGIGNVRFWTGEAVEILRDRLADHPPMDAVLVDPPRAGLHPGVVSRLIALAAPRLVYVSCNPSTLARDLGLLCESKYRIAWVQPIDMFPHTPHIECVAALERA
jgi:23S rRNA (uracil1939-C5)-methyltransferase